MVGVSRDGDGEDAGEGEEEFYSAVVVGEVVLFRVEETGEVLEDGEGLEEDVVSTGVLSRDKDQWRR